MCGIFFSANIYHLIISEWLRYWRTKPTKNGQHTFEQQQTFIPPQKCLSTLLTSKLFSLCFCFCFYFCCSNLCNFLWTIFIKGEVHSKLTKRRDYKWKYVDVKNVCGQLVFILVWKKGKCWQQPNCKRFSHDFCHYKHSKGSKISTIREYSWKRHFHLAEV